MKVVIDTNIVVSAVIAGRKPESVIIWIIGQSDYEWIVSVDILAEYQEVLARKKLKLTDDKRNKWLGLIQNSTQLIEVLTNIDFPRDQKDAKFLECAIASDADFFITGDRDFTEVQSLGNTLIISVSLFAELMMKYAGNEEYKSDEDVKK
ncbi:putative toxin-antitoxin system toxin component, PIN family [Dolichospermum circinale]|uniref:putative toxin-antitoxin system toxin component, PIN family n=1 Tax=Dolichospermum circinale TaxID=109265 RepID=UPI000485DEAF|nr:putative toxin-antitoxin system toxin component, PIN family [Dolichospermum circinale]MDB9475654.1 putative toxin-antitoxin system toxin component, PIN family [Dolichospermum circinale CS-537/11]MDB9477066.1 putative toxin-antitoxin system toxin component, PIN family [Dolichospermum circinale CS-537/03]MDB9484894.1 putative toxin-antitoxin system toxin component, PIN family [Dolichospermum circinale CS-537/05]